MWLFIQLFSVKYFVRSSEAVLSWLQLFYWPVWYDLVVVVCNNQSMQKKYLQRRSCWRGMKCEKQADEEAEERRESINVKKRRREKLKRRSINGETSVMAVPSEKWEKCLKKHMCNEAKRRKWLVMKIWAEMWLRRETLWSSPHGVRNSRPWREMA